MRTPQLLINFPAAMDEAVDAAYVTGAWSATFGTVTEAQSAKFKFYRFFKAVQFYKPDSEQARKCADLEIRIKGPYLEMVKKSSNAIMQQIEQGTQATLNGGRVLLDEEAATLERLMNEPPINPVKE